MRGLKTVQELQGPFPLPYMSFLCTVRVLCSGSIDLVPLPDSSATLLTAHNFFSVSLSRCPWPLSFSLSLDSAVANFLIRFPYSRAFAFEYISPEQTKGSVADLDPGSDVFFNPWIRDNFFSRSRIPYPYF